VRRVRILRAQDGTRRVRLQHCVRHLEQFSLERGVPVIRNSMTPGVLGRVEDRRILLRTGLGVEQQVLTLVHELTHLIAHVSARPQINRTVCEYEAEAVEKWVGTELGVPPYDQIDLATVTDDLLACSVVRVRWAARTLLSAVRGEPVAFTACSITGAIHRRDLDSVR
jgi:hypothetical protein